MRNFKTRHSQNITVQDREIFLMLIQVQCNWAQYYWVSQRLAVVQNDGSPDKTKQIVPYQNIEGQCSTSQCTRGLGGGKVDNMDFWLESIPLRYL